MELINNKYKIFDHLCTNMVVSSAQAHLKGN